MRLTRQCIWKCFALKSTTQIQNTVTNGFPIESASAKHSQPVHCLSLSSYVFPNSSTSHELVINLNTIFTLISSLPPPVSCQPPALPVDLLNLSICLFIAYLPFKALLQCHISRVLFLNLQEAYVYPFINLIPLLIFFSH